MCSHYIVYFIILNDIKNVVAVVGIRTRPVWRRDGDSGLSTTRQLAKAAFALTRMEDGRTGELVDWGFGD